MPGGRSELIVGAVSLAVAFMAWWRARPGHGPAGDTSSPRVRGIGWKMFLGFGMLLTVWGLAGGFHAIFMFSNQIKEFRALDPATTAKIEIGPGTNPDLHTYLTDRVIESTDRELIQKVVGAMLAAERWAPSHPREKWSCILRVINKTGRVNAYEVSYTSNNGLLIYVWSEVEQGWSLGLFRNDELIALLEGLIH